MSTYRKIEAEVRDEDVRTTISYSKERKEGHVTEKVFIKNTKDRKPVSQIKGNSVDGEDWVITGEDKPVDYKKYSPNALFKDFGFLTLDDKKIGGAELMGISWTGWLVVLVIILAVWFAAEYHIVTMAVDIANAETKMWNNAKPAPTKPKELVVMDFWQTAGRAKSGMRGRVGL
jgi:hypothetical protein